MQGALLNEAVRLHEEGYASIDDIDISLKHAGNKMGILGPFEIADLNAPGGIGDSFLDTEKEKKTCATTNLLQNTQMNILKN